MKRTTPTKGSAAITTQIEAATKAISAKWTIQIIRELMQGTRRFSQIEKSLETISPRTLSLRLSGMERQGIIERKVYPEVPPRVEYKLTNAGKALDTVLKVLKDWGTQYGKRK